MHQCLLEHIMPTAGGLIRDKFHVSYCKNPMGNWVTHEFALASCGSVQEQQYVLKSQRNALQNRLEQSTD
jgi:hypothetical protein